MNNKFRRTLYPSRSTKSYSLNIEHAIRKIDNTLEDFDNKTQLIILAELMKEKVDEGTK